MRFAYWRPAFWCIRILIRFFLLVIPVVSTACTYLLPANTPASEGKADIDTPTIYRCNSGRIVKSSYHSGTTAVVRYEGRTRTMTIAISGSGARYVGSGLEWWTKGMGPGSSGTLFHHERDSTTGDIVESCIQLHTSG
jgi:membrane-bound inhibitor of C-type lysozyme